jgi:hypothetical protein
VVAPGFGADAADLLALDDTISADVTASIANDAAKLPTGSAIIVDDFHVAAAAVSGDMADLVERWPVQAAQLVLASRGNPPLRLHRLRMAGQLCELRDRDLYFTLAESHCSPTSGPLPFRGPCRPGKANGRTLGAAAVTWAALERRPICDQQRRDPGRKPDPRIGQHPRRGHGFSSTPSSCFRTSRSCCRGYRPMARSNCSISSICDPWPKSNV